MAKVYLIGSLRNPKVPKVANQIRELGFEVFDDWYAAGRKADDAWRAYERGRGHTYRQALEGHGANHVFWFDFKHLKSSNIAVLLLPAGKSAHMELMWALARGKYGCVLLDSPKRWDVMYKLITDVEKGDIFENFEMLAKKLKEFKP